MFVSVLDTQRPPKGASLAEATLLGWAPDGGMFWPASIPRISQAELRELGSLNYPQLCSNLLKRFVADDDAELTHADIDAVVAEAFGRFGSDEVVELSELAGCGGLSALELWHGPSLAFKDLGMSVLGAILKLLLERRQQRLTLLVGTSGDTGSSAMEAVRRVDSVRIVVLYPLRSYSTMSAVQEWQMTSVAQAEPSVTALGVEGTSDDLDVPIEGLFRDAQFKSKHALGSVNSVNVIRLLVQTVHYFYAYLQLNPFAETEHTFAVPCGAGGHLSAGVLAIEMGLPAKLIAATNVNDAIHRLLSAGELSPSATTSTISPSMDICVPYNIWRLLYNASCRDAGAVGRWQDDFAAGRLCLPAEVRTALAQSVRSECVSDEETRAAMAKVYGSSGYVLDPHTAVGVAAALRSGPSASVTCLACAHPIKFLPTVAKALGKPEAEALAATVEGSEAHPCVAPVAAIAKQMMEAGADVDTSPPVGIEVLRRQEQAQWAPHLRAVVESLWK